MMAGFMGFEKLRGMIGKKKGIKKPGEFGDKIGAAKYGKSRFEQFAAEGMKKKEK